jgi:hypothetical protein
VIRTESLNAYFREALTEAIARTGAGVTFDVQAYVVRMLLEFSRSENAFSGVDKGDQPIYALLLSRALDSAPQEALRLYKQVGDSTLYQLGFFKEFTNQGMVNESYYLSVGELAYASASKLSGPAIPASRVYSELSDHFLELVLVFNEMSVHGERNQEAGGISTERLLILIEHFRRTQSPQIAEILRRQGVNLSADPKKT